MLRSLLFNTFITSNSGIKCVPSSFVDDTKPCGVICSTPGGWAPLRDLDKPEQGAQVNLMSCNKSQCKVLHLGSGKPHCQYKLGHERIEHCPAKRTWGYW